MNEGANQVQEFDEIEEEDDEKKKNRRDSQYAMFHSEKHDINLVNNIKPLKLKGKKINLFKI